jgi:outer membrane protein
MKNKLFASLLLCLVSLLGAESRIAHLDTKLIFDSYEGVQQVKEEYEAQLALWEQESNVLQAELNNLKEILEKQVLIISDKRKKELETKLELKQSELNEFVNAVYGPDGKMVKENKKVTAPALKRIREVINEVALQEGYDMVLDRATGAVVFWKEEDDLTNRVIKALKAP